MSNIHAAQPQTLFTWSGVSGSRYDFQVYRLDQAFRAVPAIYIFAREISPGRWENLYTGETSNISERLEHHHKEDCARRRGATHIHVREASASAELRRQAEQDLIRRWMPPCNG